MGFTIGMGGCTHGLDKIDRLKLMARFKNGVFWVPVDEPMPNGKRQLIEGVVAIKE